jgi:hypothetical protein
MESRPQIAVEHVDNSDDRLRRHNLNEPMLHRRQPPVMLIPADVVVNGNDMNRSTSESFHGGRTITVTPASSTNQNDGGRNRQRRR